MKKLFVLLAVLLVLSGCTGINKTADPNDKYSDMIQLVNDYDEFLTISDYFDVTSEETKLNDGGYRFYIVIDKAKVAMYDVEAIAIEKGVDYSNFMAANVGIFEDKTYSMIPNQSNPDKGYVSGLVISGLSQNAESTVYMLVQWKSKDLLTTTREYMKVEIKYKDDHVDQEQLDSSNDFSIEEPIEEENGEENN